MPPTLPMPEPIGRRRWHTILGSWMPIGVVQGLLMAASGEDDEPSTFRCLGSMSNGIVVLPKAKTKYRAEWRGDLAARSSTRSR